MFIVSLVNISCIKTIKYSKSEFLWYVNIFIVDGWLAFEAGEMLYQASAHDQQPTILDI